MMWALIIHLTPGDFTPAPFSCFSLGKVFMGNKKEIAESRIPEINTYMKVITFNFMHRAVFFCFVQMSCWLAWNAAVAYNLVG